ncbi:MAG: glycoside hydrolase family 15 protein [Nitriliruptorales bacterium]|nr:glycoside hydrolase family 15 protein [Nitriliruptorales bacterium]
MIDPSFKPLQRIDGYLPLEDHGLIGDGSTAALVARDGAVVWLCLPRFDSPALFCRVLDAERGGAWTVAPTAVRAARQYYEDDSGVLVTELQGPEGLVRLTDVMALRSGAHLHEDVPAARQELVRRVEVLQGRIDLRVDIEPRGNARVEPGQGGLWLRCAQRQDLNLHLLTTRSLDGARSVLALEAGDRVDLSLRWNGAIHRRSTLPADNLLDATRDAWRHWMRNVTYDGPQRAAVRRSAITLKLLDHFENGAIVAAPTSSLPEGIGGERNWDYRYSWVRDAAFSVHALRRIGLVREAWGFLAWVLDAVERGGRPRVLYDLDGAQPPAERLDEELEGYRQSAPVRWGNAAADQRQHDVYGEILDCAYQWAQHGGVIPDELWQRLRILVEEAQRAWDRPDRGIWEVRTPGRVFTYSAALCQVALDRGARIAARFGLPGDIDGWAASAEKIRQAVLSGAWDERAQAFTEQVSGGGGLDASMLTLPLRRVVPADDPRMVATTEAIVKRLGAGDGLLYRYLPDASPDGLEGGEGAFLLCSFWLVDNLAYQGRLDEAMELYERLCARSGHLGLLPEQIDPGTGAFLGNYPQAFSHVGVIASGVVLDRLTNRRRGDETPS